MRDASTYEPRAQAADSARAIEFSGAEYRVAPDKLLLADQDLPGTQQLRFVRAVESVEGTES